MQAKTRGLHISLCQSRKRGPPVMRQLVETQTRGQCSSLLPKGVTVVLLYLPCEVSWKAFLISFSSSSAAADKVLSISLALAMTGSHRQGQETPGNGSGHRRYYKQDRLSQRCTGAKERASSAPFELCFLDFSEQRVSPKRTGVSQYNQIPWKARGRHSRRQMVLRPGASRRWPKAVPGRGGRTAGSLRERPAAARPRQREGGRLLLAAAPGGSSARRSRARAAQSRRAGPACGRVSMATSALCPGDAITHHVARASS